MSTSGVEGAEPDTDVRPLPAAEAPLPPTLDLSNTLGAFFVTTRSSCCNDRVEDKKVLSILGQCASQLQLLKILKWLYIFQQRNLGILTQGRKFLA